MSVCSWSQDRSLARLLTLRHGLGHAVRHLTRTEEEEEEKEKEKEKEKEEEDEHVVVMLTGI